MEFIDKHNYNANGFYACPNEGTLDWRELIKGTPLYRAAGICSSGEIGFFSILPSVRRKLVLIDHSYASLNVAMTKYVLLMDKGPEEVYRLFTQGQHQEIHDVCMAARKELPDAVANTAHSKYGNSDWCSMTQRNEVYENGQYRWVDVAIPVNYYFDEIRAHWLKHISLDLVKQAYKKLKLVTFVHGDLQDLVEFGPFGLVYLSNALEHNNRDRKHPTLEQVRKCLRPNGYIIAAGRLHSDHLVRNQRVFDPVKGTYEYPKQTPLKEIRKCGNFGSGSLNWKQAMYQLEAAAA